MSLYHKYRPKIFEEMLGNEAIIATIKGDLAKADHPHAFLFHGPTGCGKTTLGRLVAAAVGCTGKDLAEINSADFRGIDTIREIYQLAQFRPMIGSCRVWIIDECHKLTNDAQHALLKGLEEAPRHVYYILATTDPQRLLDTIRGRCTQYQVKSLDEKAMYKLIFRVARKEGETLTQEIVDQIIQDSEGRPRNALQILDQVLSCPPEQRLVIARKTAETVSQTINLCRAIVGLQGWKKVANILAGLKDEEPESVRRAVLGYCSAILLKGEDGPHPVTAAKIMEQLEKPLFSTGYAGLVYECFSAVYRTNDDIPF
jgi:DNA polymerase III gamma/tau subunit